MTEAEKAKEAFLKDNKKQYFNMPDPIDRIMEFFAADVLDDEDKVFAEGEIYRPNDLEIEARNEIYEKLGWKNEEANAEKHEFDVINSFYTIFVCALVSYSESIKDTENFWKALNSKITANWTCRVFGTGTTTALKYAAQNELRDISKKAYAKKVLDSGNIQQKILRDFIKNAKYANVLKDLASQCHSVANFMPCPNTPFNTVKGFHKRVCDFFPLMIDLINEEKEITYTYKEEKRTVPQKEVQKWKAWFIENREAYCLEDYYDIVDGCLLGKAFFDGQSLDNPLPKKESELTECLSEMVKRITDRAEKLALRSVDTYDCPKCGRTFPTDGFSIPPMCNECAAED